MRYGDGWIPQPGGGDIFVAMAKFRTMLKAAGRDASSCPTTLTGCADDPDTLPRPGGGARLCRPAHGKRDTVRPVLDKWAGLIRQVSD